VSRRVPGVGKIRARPPRPPTRCPRSAASCLGLLGAPRLHQPCSPVSCGRPRPLATSARSRAEGGGSAQARQLVEACGARLPALLDHRDAVERLLKKKVYSIGPKRAADIKAGWDANPRACAPHRVG
jgi:hypothetical protein